MQVQDNEENEKEEDYEPEPDTTIYVKNLNFSTTDESLKDHFKKCGMLHYATVATKKDPNNPGQKLSMGYGFVRYKLKAHADNALKELQMTLLDDKRLELKRSERTLGFVRISINLTKNILIYQNLNQHFFLLKY